MDALREFYADEGPERVGLILRDGTIVELENVATNPEEAFDVRPEDLIRYEDEMVATWHTHPGASPNLSLDDHMAINNWPMLEHYIIGQGSTRRYTVRNGSIVVDG